MVEIEFPGYDFDDDAWMAISAKKDADAVYDLLTPRQRLNAAPSAVNHTLEPWNLASNDLVTGDGSTQVVINRSSPSNDVTYLTVGTPAGATEWGGMYVLGAHSDAKPFSGLRNDGGDVVYNYLDGVTGEWRFYFNGGDNFILLPGGNAELTGTLDAGGYNGSGTIFTSGNITSGSVMQALDFEYTFSLPCFLSINAAAFQPSEDGEDYRNNGTAYMNVASGAGYFVAPLNLPHGAEVTSLEFDARDNSATRDMTCQIRRLLNGGASVNVMADVVTSGASSAWQTFTDNSIINPEIDNFSYSYLLRVYCPAWQGKNTAFTRVKIIYRVNKPD